MLSRPSRGKSSCLDMLAAKACSPGRDSILLRRGEHAFAASKAPATTLFSEGRESMAPTFARYNPCILGNRTQET